MARGMIPPHWPMNQRFWGRIRLLAASVSIRRGPYGPYVQIDVPEDSKDKPKRQGIPRGVDIAAMDLAAALKLLALPREVGMHPESGKKIEAGIGRFGPYLKHDGKFNHPEG